MSGSDTAPLVSVCIPCFNSEPFLREAIDSALSQTYRRVEVIVVDDGSSDGSVSILQEYAEQLPPGRFRFEAGPNRGACSARNRALELSSGEFINFLDADDRLLPLKLEIQVPVLQNDEADLVFCKGFIFGDGKPLRPKKRVIPSPAGVDPFVYCLNTGLSTEGPLHRRKLLEEVGAFRPEVRRGQEWDLHIRLAAAGARIRLLDDLLYEHRNHDDPRRITRSELAGDNNVRLLLQLSGILGDLPPHRKCALAELLAASSLGAFRAGYKDIAEEGICEARNLDPAVRLPGGTLYRLAGACLGIGGAETLSRAARRVKTTLGL